MLKTKFFRRFHSQLNFFTKDRYNVKRGNFGVITDKHVQQFERILGAKGVLTNPDDIEPYNVDCLKMVRGCSKIVLRPTSTPEVSDILRICNQDNFAVCPQGGNTSIVGGSVPVFDEIVISTSLMNNILKVDDLAGTISCDAGCVLERLDAELAKHGLMMPLDLAAKGTCQIGGNISTSAGGLRVLRYGSMQANTLGLQVVLADGSVLDLMNALKKDNTGYHLRQLFIGAEGTLGVVTKAVIQCPVRPQSTCLAFLGMDEFSNVLSTFQLAKKQLSETLSACEMMDAVSMESVVNNLNLKRLLSTAYEFYMIIETQGSREDHDNEKMEGFLEKAITSGIIKDGTFTSDPAKINKAELDKSKVCAKNEYRKDIRQFTSYLKPSLFCVDQIINQDGSCEACNILL
ncbi:D-2-hydroxyglutarate dehydrogenase, mitochondrial-like isoform X2 [Rhodnius prolixus]|uniref:D-2-hydroxyglutarate dehydrogenase, mitochondrial-like isoform X2 n=1 Tax=Rhodnius prolixus TaxID=13249 RepID=UPI003D18E911